MSEQLFQAVKEKDAKAVANIIKKGADINAQDSNGRTPLMIATRRNDAATAKVLIDAGADVNIQDHIKDNPFLYAGAEGYLEILKLTIDAGADSKITNRYGGTALIPASEHGYVDVVKELLTRTDIDVNHVNNLGWTALLEAIILNDGGLKQQQTVQLLIDHGADVNIADRERVTPLQHAREKEFAEIERILVKAGAQ
ncbi:ankyrin [Paenibacillus sp. DMB20]|nr:ankyrin [Paenibacillus sp. DMB20]